MIWLWILDRYWHLDLELDLDLDLDLDTWPIR